MKTKWELSIIQNTDDVEALKKEIKDFVDDFVSKWSDLSFLNDEETVKKALDDYTVWYDKYSFSNYRFYLHLSESLDQSNSELKKQKNKWDDFFRPIANRMIFFENALSKVNAQKQNDFLNSKLLKNHHHYLKRLFDEGKHRLTNDQEQILSSTSQYSTTNWFNMLQEFLSDEEAVIEIDGKKQTKNFSEIIELTNDKNETKRKLGFEEINKIFEKHIKTGEHEINNIYRYKATLDDLRGFKRADESRHLNEDVDTEIVDMFIDTVSEYFDIAKDYYKLKAKLLGKEKLNYYDRNVEIGDNLKKHDFDESYELVHKVFNNLDDEFGQIYKDFFANGQVDVYPKKGKTSGAFCSFANTDSPIFVLLNHHGTLNNLQTLAHEFGHAIHFELAKNQHPFYADAPMCTAETASTFFEDFVLDEVLQTSDKSVKLPLLMQKLNDEVSTIFRQVAFYNFEFELHKRVRKEGYVDYKSIGELFTKHMQSYMGDSVIQDEGAANWWLYVPHFRYNFYVYSYAFGLLISKYLQRLVKEDKRNIAKVKEFLKAGSSKSPKDIFASLGIDISKKSFWQEGLNEVRETLKEAEKLI